MPFTLNTSTSKIHPHTVSRQRNANLPLAVEIIVRLAETAQSCFIVKRKAVDILVAAESVVFKIVTFQTFNAVSQRTGLFAVGINILADPTGINLVVNKTNLAVSSQSVNSLTIGINTTSLSQCE